MCQQPQCKRRAGEQQKQVRQRTASQEKTTTASSALQRVAVTSCTTCHIADTSPWHGAGLGSLHTHGVRWADISSSWRGTTAPPEADLSEASPWDRHHENSRTAPLVPGALTRSAEPGWLRVPGCGLGVCGCLLSGSGRPRSCDSSTAQRAPAPLPNRGLREGGEPRDSRRLREEAGAGGSGDSPAAGIGLGKQELCLQEHGDLRAAPGCSCRPRGELWLWPGPCRLTRPCPPSAARRSAGCTPTSPRGRSGRWLHLERGERRGTEDGDRRAGGSERRTGTALSPRHPAPAPSPPPVRPAPSPPSHRPLPTSPRAPIPVPPPGPVPVPLSLSQRCSCPVPSMGAAPRPAAGRAGSGAAPGGSPAQRPARPRPLLVLPPPVPGSPGPGVLGALRAGTGRGAGGRWGPRSLPACPPGRAHEERTRTEPLLQPAPRRAGFHSASTAVQTANTAQSPPRATPADRAVPWRHRARGHGAVPGLTPAVTGLVSAGECFV